MVGSPAMGVYQEKYSEVYADFYQVFCLLLSFSWFTVTLFFLVQTGRCPTTGGFPSKCKFALQQGKFYSFLELFLCLLYFKNNPYGKEPYFGVAYSATLMNIFIFVCIQETWRDNAVLHGTRGESRVRWDRGGERQFFGRFFLVRAGKASIRSLSLGERRKQSLR